MFKNTPLLHLTQINKIILIWTKWIVVTFVFALKRQSSKKINHEKVNYRNLKKKLLNNAVKRDEEKNNLN